MLAEDQSRLQKIDALYDLRLDQYVSLPQLVVVGDQSSGKSSVLEGLTGLPFPRDSGLCTRFPTQIVFKRSKVATIEASIMAAHGQDSSKVDAIAKFGKKQLQAFDQKTFSKTLFEASECMGLPLPGCSREVNMESFSINILKIELSGPEYEHFSVVDLPGLFRKPTEGQTTKVDMDLVRQMVGKYLSNPRSIILAVVPANVDIATQEIIQMAEDTDPYGHRTLGVLTKPDLVDKGAEDKVMELVINTKGEGRFKLGYTIVCNRSQSDLSITFEERNAKEVAFFDSSPWSSIPKERAGVKALKHRLDNLLIDVTRRNYQGVSVDIRKRIRNLEQQLEIIGPVRQTAYEQRNHLINVASRFRELTMKAIDAYYSRDECFEKDDAFRLATIVMELNEQFSESVYKKGYTRAFAKDQSTVANIRPSIRNPAQSPIRSLAHSPIRSPAQSPIHSSTGPSTPETDLPEYPELQSIMALTEVVPKSAEDGIMEWVTAKYTRSKGFEIGTINPSLMPSLFAEQSRSWGFHAQNHVTRVIRKIHDFNHKLLQYCCNDDALCDRLWEKLLPPLLTSYEKALKQASFLVDVERHGNLITMNHYFAENVSKAREARLKAKLGTLYTWNPCEGRAEPLLRLDDILRVVISNDNHTIQDLHDTLKSYYKVARKRFVDAICLQAVDHYLISGITSPLWVFSPHFIGKMSDSELQLIAGDEDETVSRRNKLETELDSLRKGERILEN